jgi:hypothetical protein
VTPDGTGARNRRPEPGGLTVRVVAATSAFAGSYIGAGTGGSSPGHDRMPMILTAESFSFAEWLDPDTPERLGEMLADFPADRMAVAEANPVVNKAGVEGPECLAVG